MCKTYPSDLGTNIERCMELRNTSTPSKKSSCCCGREDCSVGQEHQRIVKELKEDLGLAAKAGMQLMKQTQENENIFKSEIHELGTENSRLLRQNAQLVSECTERSQAQMEAQSRVLQLEKQLSAAQARASQLSSYYALATALEEQVSTLETMRANLEHERDTAKADSVAFETRYRASEKLASQIQKAYDALETSLPQYKQPSPKALSTAPNTPQIRLFRHAMITPDPTPDVSLDVDTSIDESETTLASELEAFDLKPRLTRATSFESIFAPPPLNLQPVFAPQFGARPSIVSTAAPERVVVSGVRAGPGRGAARAFLGTVKR